MSLRTPARPTGGTTATAPEARPAWRRLASRWSSPTRKRHAYTRRQRWIIGTLNLGVFLVVWQIAATVSDIPKLFLPSVTEVWGELVEMGQEGLLLPNLWISLVVYLIGMAISLAIAVPMGLAIGGIKILDRILHPYIWAVYTTPRLILMPLVLLWVGINDTARIVIIVLSAVPATLVVVMEGVKTVDTSLLRAGRSFGAGRLSLFRSVVFPATVPFIATGVKMGVSRGLIGLFIGELFTAADGIGYLITLATKTFNTARTFGVLFIFILFCVSVISLTQLIERKVSQWRENPIAA